jgi:hypothetical protein
MSFTLSRPFYGSPQCNSSSLSLLSLISYLGTNLKVRLGDSVDSALSGESYCASWRQGLLYKMCNNYTASLSVCVNFLGVRN